MVSGRQTPRKMSMDPEYYFKKISSQNRGDKMDNKPLKYIIQTETQDGKSLLIQDTAGAAPAVKKRGPKPKSAAGAKKPNGGMNRSSEPVFVSFS